MSTETNTSINSTTTNQRTRVTTSTSIKSSTTNPNRTYGYARVSTKDQHEDRQLSALTEQGIAPENIFIDKKSGKDFNRQEYQRLVAELRPEDVIFIKSIDRLGRNYR
jgi:predicted site-specific integrase-resolvase